MLRVVDSSSNEIQVYFDGLCQPYNPGGISCYAFVILAKKGHEQQQQYSEYGLAAEPFSDNAINSVPLRLSFFAFPTAYVWLLV
jgi:hypothetical protein